MRRTTRHLFAWKARRARRRWMRSRRGRDSYVYRRGFLHHEVSYIDYAGTTASTPTPRRIA